MKRNFAIFFLLCTASASGSNGQQSKLRLAISQRFFTMGNCFGGFQQMTAVSSIFLTRDSFAQRNLSAVQAFQRKSAGRSAPGTHHVRHSIFAPICNNVTSSPVPLLVSVENWWTEDERSGHRMSGASTQRLIMPDLKL